jgi:group I intron endonuclease
MTTVSKVFTLESRTNKKDHSFHAVYKATNRANGKIYVGSAMSFHQRFSTYRNCSNNDAEGGRMYRAIRKHGFDKFQFEILEIVSDASLLIQREQHWLDTLQPFNENGYNICRTAGSCLGKKHTLSAKKKMSESRRGRVITVEWRKNLSIASKARAEEISMQKSKAVVQIDKHTLSVIGEFKSARMAAQSLGYKKDVCIGKACSGIAVSALGFYWAWKSEYMAHGFTPSAPKKCDSSGAQVMRPVYQMINGGITMWDSASDAARALNAFGPSKIVHACRHGNIAHKSRWRYVEDDGVIRMVRERRLNAWRREKLAA